MVLDWCVMQVDHSRPRVSPEVATRDDVSNLSINLIIWTREAFVSDRPHFP